MTEGSDEDFFYSEETARAAKKTCVIFFAQNKTKKEMTCAAEFVCAALVSSNGE